MAPLWACTDVLQRLQTGDDIKVYIDSEYVCQGIRDRSIRLQSEVYGPAALLNSAWKALDQAVARHKGKVKWIPYEPLEVLKAYEAVQKSKRHLIFGLSKP